MRKRASSRLVEGRALRSCQAAEAVVDSLPEGLCTPRDQDEGPLYKIAVVQGICAEWWFIRVVNGDSFC
jgi:hypothetical protein